MPTTTTTITRRYHFEAAHYLPRVPDGHKCKRMHGHNYELLVTVKGPVGSVGFIIDFWDLDKTIQPLIDLVDHRCLNDEPGLDNPTAENIAAWFLHEATRSFILLGMDMQIYKLAMTIFETKDCWADVRSF